MQSHLNEYISSIMLSSSIFQLKLYATKIKPNPDIDSTYQADAFNMDTLDQLYTDITFSTQDIQIYCTVSRCYFFPHHCLSCGPWLHFLLFNKVIRSQTRQVFQQLGNCYCSCHCKFNLHAICCDTGYSCSGLSKRSTRLPQCKFQCTSISLPRTNTILGWNCFNNNNDSHDNGNDRIGLLPKQ